MSLLYDTEVAEVAARGRYVLWVRFADGVEGEADLSAELDDPSWEGTLQQWLDPGFFDTVKPDTSGVVWGDASDPDAIRLSGGHLYAQIRGLTDEEMHPELHVARVVKARPLSRYRVWVRFADGAEGRIDLSAFAGKGVFRQWDEPGVWERMRIRLDTLEWGSDDPTRVLDFCPEMLYSRLTGVDRDEMHTASFARRALQRLRAASGIRQIA